MKEVTLQAFVDRINAGLMELEQVPVPYQGAVQTKIESGDIEKAYDA